MSINKEKMASMFFETGLALKLGKISKKEVETYISESSLLAVTGKVESKEEESWNGSHIGSGELLKAAIRAEGITQTELAGRMDATPQKINDLINGRVVFTVGWAKRASKALNLSYKNFL